MLVWNEFIKLLGCSKLDDKFVNILSSFNQLPKIDRSILGGRDYYSFFYSGVLFLLEDEVVDQIYFYTKQDDGFSVYKGELPVKINSSEHEAIQILGYPSASGGGKMDTLMGYMARWIKYEKEGYTLHLQFNPSDNLSRVTLMK